jgi:hypothetical protein
MTQEEEIKIRMGFDAASIEKGMQVMLDNQRTYADTFKGIWNKVGGTLAALFTVDAFKSFASSVTDFSKQISETAERLGVTTEEVQKLQYAGAMTGVELNTIAQALDKLAQAKEKVLNNDKGADKLIEDFQRFGITIQNLETMSPSDLFNAISKSVATTGVNASVTAGAMELFGRAGGKLLPVLQEFREQSEKAPIVSDQDIQNIRQAADAMEGLKIKIEATGAYIFGHLADASRWKKAWYGFLGTFGIGDYEKKYEAMGGEEGEIANANAAQPLGPPAPKSIASGDGSDGDGVGGAGGTGAAGGKGMSGTDALYRRRAELLRKIRNVSGNSYSDFQGMAKELRGINDQLDVKNAPDTLSKLYVQRDQATRDLRIAQTTLPIGDAARAANVEKIHSLADVAGGFNSQISDFNKSDSQKLLDHMISHSQHLEKIAGAISNGKMNAQIFDPEN